jgi:serine/threonine-protein kinase
MPPATLVFAITPWGEIFVNGKSRGVTPPMKSLKLEPGKYRIEVRNTTFPSHTENLDVKPRDEITVRHKFQ